MVQADDSQSRYCGFEPQPRILDGMQAKLAITLKIKRNKGSQMGHTKKIFKKKIALSLNIKFKNLQQKNQPIIIVSSSKSYQRYLQFAKRKFNTLMGPFK